MPDFVTVAKISDIQPGKGKAIEVKGKNIALFNVNGKFHAIDNTCLHQGGPLGEGTLQGDVVTCPWHGWRYNVTTGVNQANPSWKVASYEVKVDGDEVQVKV